MPEKSIFRFEILEILNGDKQMNYRARKAISQKINAG